MTSNHIQLKHGIKMWTVDQTAYVDDFDCNEDCNNISKTNLILNLRPWSHQSLRLEVRTLIHTSLL